MNQALGRHMSKNELIRLIKMQEKEAQSLRVTVAIQREFLQQITGRDVDKDLAHMTRT